MKTIHEVILPGQCFLRCTNEEDLTPSLENNMLVSAWMDMLPVSRFAARCFQDHGELGFIMDATTAHIYQLDGEGTVVEPEGAFYALLYDGDEKESLKDPRIRKLITDGYILKEPFYRIYLMIGTEEYSEYIHYILLRK